MFYKRGEFMDIKIQISAESLEEINDILQKLQNLSSKKYALSVTLDGNFFNNNQPSFEKNNTEFWKAFWDALLTAYRKPLIKL